MIPVAAAASVPFSSTLMYALWTAAEMKRSRPPVMPEKSAALFSKRLLHAQRGERVVEPELIGHLEFGQADDESYR